MASKLGIFRRHTRPVFMLWFLTFVFLVWQTINVLRINKHCFCSPLIESRVNLLGNDIHHKDKDNVQRDVVYKTKHVITSNELGRTNSEYKSNVMRMITHVETKSSNESTLKSELYMKTTSKPSLQQQINSSLNFSILIKEKNVSNKNNNVNKVDSGMTSKIEPFKGNISTLYLIDTPLICKNIQFPMESIPKQKMQWVETVNSTLVYSAYYDVDEPYVIKIVAVCYKNTASPYFCQVWYKGTESGAMTMIITNATYFFTKKSGRTYVSCYINCVLPYTRAPSAVSVVLQAKCLSATNLLEVTPTTSKIYSRNFTLCLSALHYDYNKAEQLVEWIEFNKILGAEHFIIYNFTSGQSVQKVLEYYTRQGIVEVLQWPLPSKIIKKHLRPSIFVHYLAQTGSYSDCLQRSKVHSKYVVVTDLDEFIVPRVDGDKTWKDMLKHLPEAHSFLFKNCFFSSRLREKKYPEKEIAEKYKLKSLLVLERHTRIWDHQRFKYIASTATSKSLDTHQPRGGTRHMTDPSIGLLHHYRNYMGIGKNVTTDETVLKKYGRDIVSSVIKAWKEISNY